MTFGHLGVRNGIGLMALGCWIPDFFISLNLFKKNDTPTGTSTAVISGGHLCAFHC